MDYLQRIRHGTIELEIFADTNAVIEIRRGRGDGAERKSPLTEEAAKELREYLEGKRRSFSFPIACHGTDFELEVWEALRAIPFGETRTYGQIAAQIGRPRACRAVGSAVGKNSLLIVIPCHRVIAANWKIGGFSCGIDLKISLLEKEGIRFSEQGKNGIICQEAKASGESLT